MSIPRSQVSRDHPYICKGDPEILGFLVCSSYCNSLSWSSHVRSIHNGTNSTLVFLRRNLRRCPAELKETAYITLVRSILEYAAPVWDPHLARACDFLEKIERRSARFVKGDHRTTSSVTQMLHDLGWRDLSDRRRDLRLLRFGLLTSELRCISYCRSFYPTVAAQQSTNSTYGLYSSFNQGVWFQLSNLQCSYK